MNKQTEFQALYSVFGQQRFESVVDCEEPDFICTASNGICCGVEITECYPTDSDARLRNIPYYAVKLLEGGAYKHKHDKKELKVEEVVYKPVNAAEGRKIKAIRRPVLTTFGAVCRVLDSIRFKESKLPAYAAKTGNVILIVNDVEAITRFRSVSEIVEVIWHQQRRPIISQSGFWEIYLLSKHDKDGNVCIPLRANILLAEILTFQCAYRKLLKRNEERSTVGQFISALGSYLRCNFAGMWFNLVEDAPSFLCGNTQVAFDRSGVWNASELFTDRHGWTKLPEYLEDDNTDRSDKILELMAEEFICVNLYFEAKK